MRNDIINPNIPIRTKNYIQYLSYMTDKSLLFEYISSNSSQSGEVCMNEAHENITKEDELIVVKYLLDIMRAHDIITEEEYCAVLYKYRGSTDIWKIGN